MSCISYPGGKYKIFRNHLKQLLPPEPVETYREPFCGSATVCFGLKKLGFAKNYLINDQYDDLINFWEIVRDQPTVLVEHLTKMKLYLSGDDQKGKAYFYHTKQLLDNPRAKQMMYPYERAAAFFYLSRTSYGATITAGGYSSFRFLKRFTPSSLDRIKEASELLQGVDIANQDFQPIIENPGRDVFLYCDPPYVTANRLYGPNGQLHTDFDFQRLADCLKHTKHRFMLSYDNCPVVRLQYAWANIHKIPVTYSMNSHRKASELVITNY
jgi:DNA adenine methylase